MDRIIVLSAALRRAVAAEQYAQVQHLTAEYAGLVTARWRALPRGDPEIESLWREARELLGWARQTSLAQRAHVATQVETIQPLIAYLRGERGSRNTWQTEG